MSYEKFAYYYDSLMDQKFYDDYLLFILKHATFTNCLEIGCGTGEMAIRLAKKNIQVYATDYSKDMLDIARLKAMNENVNLMLARIDMRDYSVDQELDCVLCLCDSINYVLKEGEVLQTFKNVYQSLKKDGYFIFDANSLYKMNQTLANYDEEQDDEDFYFHWHVDKIGEGKVQHLVKIIDREDHDEVEEIHIQQTYSVEQYKTLLEKAGFKDIEIYSDFNDYNEEAQRHIFVCKRG